MLLLLLFKPWLENRIPELLLRVSKKASHSARGTFTVDVWQGALHCFTGEDCAAQKKHGDFKFGVPGTPALLGNAKDSPLQFGLQPGALTTSTN